MAEAGDGAPLTPEWTPHPMQGMAPQGNSLAFTVTYRARFLQWRACPETKSSQKLSMVERSLGFRPSDPSLDPRLAPLGGQATLD